MMVALSANMGLRYLLTQIEHGVPVCTKSATMFITALVGVVEQVVTSDGGCREVTATVREGGTNEDSFC
jgi:hypothetical protein